MSNECDHKITAIFHCNVVIKFVSIAAVGKLNVGLCFSNCGIVTFTKMLAKCVVLSL